MHELIDIEKGQYAIASPCDGRHIVCDSFDEAMQWFEGYNLPYKCIGKKLEKTESANKRVKKYFEELKDE